MSWWQELQSRMAEGCSLLARNHSKDIQMNEHWLGHLHSMGDFLLSSLETAEPCTEFNKNLWGSSLGIFWLESKPGPMARSTANSPAFRQKQKVSGVNPSWHDLETECSHGATSNSQSLFLIESLYSPWWMPLLLPKSQRVYKESGN